ncbi:MAG: chromosomal replication initiator protein DnaA [Bosea sp. (in: a-proteobacteria)]
MAGPSLVQPDLASRDLAAAWARVRARLKAEMGEDVFSSWFGRLEIETVSHGVARLTVPTRFLKSWIDSRYADRLRVHCQAELAAVETVELGVRQTSRTTPNAANMQLAVVPQRSSVALPASIQAQQPLANPPANQHTNPHVAPAAVTASDTLGVSLDRRLTFQSFILGRSNALAFAAGERIAAAPAGSAIYNPLYIHAGVGLGKTHLVQAIAQEAQKFGRRVVYLTADRFMYGFVSALKSQTALAFKETLRGIDMLIIDDVQFIQGKQIQQEFGHTIHALIDAGKQVIVAADRLPSELESLDERVRSRLAGGLAVEIGPLDEELRIRILQSRIQALKLLHSNFEVTGEIIAEVARAVATNGRDLDGAANRLLAHTTLTGAPLSLEAAESAISDLVRTREPRRVKIEDIQKLVATRYNVSRADILSERRTAAVVKPRQIAMYLSKALTPRSLPEIGRRFGGRDHTTVLHAVRKIEKALTDDRSLTEEIELIKRMLLD